MAAAPRTLKLYTIVEGSALPGDPATDWLWLQSAYERVQMLNWELKDLATVQGDTSAEYIRALLQAVRQFPNDELFLMQLGKLAEKFSYPDIAVRAYEKILDVNPLNRRALQAVSILLRDKGDYDRAIAHTTTLIGIRKPHDMEYAIALAVRATAYDAKKDYDRALQDTDAMLGLPRSSPKTKLIAHDIRANVYYHKGDYRNVIQEATELLDLSDNSPYYIAEVLNLRTYAYVHIKDFRRALEDASRRLVLWLPEDKPAALKVRAYIYTQSGDYRAAIKDLTDSLNIEGMSDQDRLAALKARAHTYNLRGEHNLALADADAMLGITGISPKDMETAQGLKAQAFTGLALATMNPQYRARFLASVREVCATVPDNPTLTYYAAKADYYEGHHGRALEKARSLITRNDDLVFKVLYMLVAPEKDALSLQFPALLGPKEFSLVQRLVDEWRHNEGDPPNVRSLERFWGRSIWEGDSSRPANRMAAMGLAWD